MLFAGPATDSSNRRIGLGVNINGAVRVVCLRFLKPNGGLARRDLDRKAAAAASTSSSSGAQAYTHVHTAPHAMGAHLVKELAIIANP